MPRASMGSASGGVHQRCHFEFLDGELRNVVASVRQEFLRLLHPQNCHSNLQEDAAIMVEKIYVTYNQVCAAEIYFALS